MGYSQQVKEDAARISAHLGVRGVCCGRPFGSAPGPCAGLAMEALLSGDRLLQMRDAFAKEVGIPDSVDALIRWNDASGRTPDEVIGAFDRIANS